MKEFGARSNGAQKRNGGGYNEKTISQCARTVPVDFANKNCENCANEKTFRDLGSGFDVLLWFYGT